MKDNPPRAATNINGNEFSTRINIVDESNPADSDEQKHLDLRQIEDVVSRYVRQLLHGCNDPACTETLCDTGRRKVSSQPVRKYTPRAARAIAVTLASGPKPKSRLCPRYATDRDSNNRVASEGPRDPAAFLQQLADTTSVRRLDVHSWLPSEVQSTISSIHRPRHTHEYITDLRFWHSRLDEMSKSFDSNSNDSLYDLLDENETFPHRLSNCIEWLLRGLPHGNSMQWRHVNKIVSAGCAYPQDNRDVPCDASFNTWLDILDGMDYSPSFQLLSQLLSVLDQTRRIEGRLVFESAKSLTSKVVAILLRGKTRLSEALDIIVWLKKIFLHHWGGEIRVTERSLAFIALKMLDRLFRQATASDMSIDFIVEVFSLPVVAYRLDAVDLVQTWMSGQPRYGHMLEFEFLFTIHQIAAYFRMMNHLIMRKADSDAEVASTLHSKAGLRYLEPSLESRLKYLEDHYLLLNVSRDNVLQDAFDQLWQRRSGELLRPLRVRLGEMDGFEVGHDLGGVQIEFFNLVCKEIFRESAQMFTTDPATGYSYFRPGSLQPLYMFELCGLLFALAIYNGISLPINLSRAFYFILAGKPLNLSSIAGAWPVIKRSLDNLLEGDVPGIERTFPLEANGLRLSVVPHEVPVTDSSGRIVLRVLDATPIVHHESQTGVEGVEQGQNKVHSSSRRLSVDIDSIADTWPGWHLVRVTEEPAEITNENKSAYIQDYVLWLALHSVEPQLRAFRKGFEAVLDDISMIPFHFLQSIVEGSTNFDIHELRKVTTYDGFEASSRYIQNFWRLIASWPKEKQKKLLKFVTACERIPPGGAGNLTFRIQHATTASLDHLPTSSTCFGTLMLPKYPSTNILDEKLSLALKYGVEGFGSG